jgi:protein-tyrosine kinase
MSRANVRLVTATGVKTGDATSDAQGAPVDTRIGQTLVALGRLKDPQVSIVLNRQAGDPRRFGELAIALGFVTQSDIDLALARQRAVPMQEIVNRLPSALAPSSPLEAENVETLLAVRAQLVHRWFGNEPERRILAIVSPNRADGRSWVTANLGRLFAELDDETLLIDGCLQQPSLHATFGLDNRTGVSSYLAGELDQPPIRAVQGAPHLHLLSAGPMVAAPNKLFAHRAFGLMLEQLAMRFSAIFVDTPAASEGGTALTLALRSSGALLVVRRDRTRLSDVTALRDRLKQMTVEVLGAVINEGG